MTERGTGRLVGIIHNRDVRFATDPNLRVYELMTRENLVTAGPEVTPEQARGLLHKHRIEKLLVVDDAFRCVGLVTVKDMDKAHANPNAVKDGMGRLRVAAATGVGDDGMRRAELLVAAEVCGGGGHRAWPQPWRDGGGSSGSSACPIPCRWWPATWRRRRARWR